MRCWSTRSGRRSAIVGPQLLYPDRKVQHAGMFLATPASRATHSAFAAAEEPGYFGLALTQRNVIAVTGACMLMRRSIFQALGGFEEAHEIINNDLDFCLRAHRAGKLIVFTPYASLMHHEAASRDRLKDVFDLSHFETRWKTLFAAGDPYFSPRLTRHSDDYRPDDEPARSSAILLCYIYFLFGKNHIIKSLAYHCGNIYILLFCILL